MSIVNRFGWAISLWGLSCGLVVGQGPIYQANAGSIPQSTVQFQDQQNQMSQQTNIFLEYYSRQGSEFSASVFIKSGKKLTKKNINYDDMKKAIVVFYGNWCPHCAQFISELSKHIGKLKAHGINVMFINVPVVDKLKNWEDPTEKDFSQAEEKVVSHGITLSKGVSVVLLGDRITLAKAGVESLPVVLVLKDSKEQFRGIGQSGTAKMNFSDPAVLNQFLEIWKEEDSKIKESKELNKSSKSKNNRKSKAGGKKSQRRDHEIKRYFGVNLAEARNATEQLNEFDRQGAAEKRIATVSDYKHHHHSGCSCSRLN